MKDWDKMTDEEKEVLSVNAVGDLIKTLDGADDIYKQIVLEELFRFVMGDKSE